MIMGQVNGMDEAKEERMRKYLSRVMRLMKRFEKADFVQIPKEENVEADTVAKEALANKSMDEFDEIQYRYPKNTTGGEQRKLDDPDCIILERWKTPKRE